MFHKIYRDRVKAQDYPIVIKTHYLDEPGNSRVGFVIKKKTGNAVFRNKLRRVLRTAFFKYMSEFKKSSWVLFEVKPFSSETTLVDIRRKAEKLLSHV